MISYTVKNTYFANMDPTMAILKFSIRETPWLKDLVKAREREGQPKAIEITKWGFDEKPAQFQRGWGRNRQGRPIPLVTTHDDGRAYKRLTVRPARMCLFEFARHDGTWIPDGSSKGSSPPSTLIGTPLLDSANYSSSSSSAGDRSSHGIFGMTRLRLDSEAGARPQAANFVKEARARSRVLAASRPFSMPGRYREGYQGNSNSKKSFHKRSYNKNSNGYNKNSNGNKKPVNGMNKYYYKRREIRYQKPAEIKSQTVPDLQSDFPGLPTAKPASAKPVRKWGKPAKVSTIKKSPQRRPIDGFAPVQGNPWPSAQPVPVDSTWDAPQRKLSRPKTPQDESSDFAQRVPEIPREQQPVQRVPQMNNAADFPSL